MCYARMVWLLGEHFLEHGARLELPRVGLVREFGGFVESEGIEDRGLAVVRVPQGQLLHGFLVGEDTRLVVDRVEVAIVRVERGDQSRSRWVGALAALAFSMASAPCFRVAIGTGIRGFWRMLIARPQYPMAQPGSVSVTAVNAFTVSG